MSLDVRLVAIDLDGTLLDSRGVVPRENVDALEKCAARGVTVAIVTGRRLPAARGRLGTLTVNPFIVANSGAFVLEGLEGRILRRRLLPRALARIVLDTAARSGVEPVVHDGPNAEGFLILQEGARDEPHLSRYLNQAEPRPRWTSSIELERDPVQVGFASSVATIRKLEDRIGSALGSRLEDVTLARTEYAARDLGLLDVLSEDASKARALSFLCEHLGIPRTRTLAIGDNWNDLDMLEHAGTGVVMANAPEALRSRSFAVAGRNDDAGVAEALERLVVRPDVEKKDTGQKKGG